MENIIDFVLTYTVDDSDDIIRQRTREEYLRNLRKTGLIVKIAPSVIHHDTRFVLIYGTKKLLTFFASFFGIQLSCENPYYVKERHRGLLAFSCRVNSITYDDPEFEMAPDTFSGERPREITNCERIMVTYQLLRNTQYGPLPTQHGILRLLEKSIFHKAYPLHEYHNEWSTGKGYLTDRELLIRYWANPKCFLKRQPLNLVEKYFGSEVGFYYAFLNQYIYCMFYASLIGGCSFMYGVFTIRSQENIRSFQICGSNITICPNCPNFEVCKYVELHNSCIHAYLTHILDNKGTVLYAVLISLWTTIYFELWKRRQAALAYEWNVMSSHIDISVRPEYEVKAHLKRISPITGNWEYYEPKTTRYKHLFISYSLVVLLIMVAIMGVIAIRFYTAFARITLGLSTTGFLKKYANILAAATASSLSVIMMLVLENIYVRLSKILTDLENPRTEVEYDNSYIYKRFILTFINGYALTCYIAFFQGRFLTHPGELDDYKSHIQYQTCEPAGCSINLAIHLVIVLFIKSFVMNAVQVIQPIFITWFKSGRLLKCSEKLDLPVWEDQHQMAGLDRFFLVNEYQEIALQYGFVAFFSSALTLAPIFALLHAMMSIRVDGQKFVLRCTRPVPIRVSGILAWEGIFRSLTLIGVVMNAIVISFTMDFIPRQIFDYKLNITEDFVTSTLSVFDTDDYADKQNISHPKICYYKAQRYPPGHPKKYQLTKDHWFDVTMRMAFVIIYELIVFTVTTILAYAIPDVPKSIKQKVEYEKAKLLKHNIEELESKNY